MNYETSLRNNVDMYDRSNLYSQIYGRLDLLLPLQTVGRKRRIWRPIPWSVSRNFLSAIIRRRKRTIEPEDPATYSV